MPPLRNPRLETSGLLLFILAFLLKMWYYFARFPRMVREFLDN